METKYGSFPPEKVDVSWVDYSYVVNGRKYSGTAVIGSSTGPGFTVYYDPDHPEQSRLHKLERSAIAEIVGLTIIFFLGGIVLGFGGIPSS
jgi:hypothetical protein